MLAVPARSEDSPTHAFFRRGIGLSDSDIASIKPGRVVSRRLPGADRPEMAAFGPVRVAAEKAVFLQRLREAADSQGEDGGAIGWR
jgi:hypothetical protein